MHLDFEKSWAFNADGQYQNTQQVVSEFAMQLTVSMTDTQVPLNCNGHA